MKKLCLVLGALLVLAAGRAGAHPTDVSQMRVRLAHQQVEFRLTLNVLTLSRIVAVDADHDRRITPQEIARAVPAVAAYLKKKVLVSVNEANADLGDFQRYECVWPHSDTEAVTDQDASQRYVDFAFVKPWPAGVQEVWTGFQVFAEVGDQHTIQAIYQQAGQPDLPVDFTQREPEYLYDTGWPPGMVQAAVTEPAGGMSFSWRFIGLAGLVVMVGLMAGWRRGHRSVRAVL